MIAMARALNMTALLLITPQLQQLHMLILRKSMCSLLGVSKRNMLPRKDFGRFSVVLILKLASANRNGKNQMEIQESNYMRKRDFCKIVGAFAIFISLSCGAISALADAPLHIVHLIINYGDGVQKRFDAIPWTKGMTGEDLLNQAKSSTHGISFQATGTGATFFLQKIDDLLNEGSGSTKRNWQYWLNTNYATVGAGAQQLQPDDVVTWKFDTYPPSTK